MALLRLISLVANRYCRTEFPSYRDEIWSPDSFGAHGPEMASQNPCGVPIPDKLLFPITFSFEPNGIFDTYSAVAVLRIFQFFSSVDPKKRVVESSRMVTVRRLLVLVGGSTVSVTPSVPFW